MPELYSSLHVAMNLLQKNTCIKFKTLKFTNETTGHVVIFTLSTKKYVTKYEIPHKNNINISHVTMLQLEMLISCILQASLSICWSWLESQVSICAITPRSCNYSRYSPYHFSHTRKISWDQRNWIWSVDQSTTVCMYTCTVDSALLVHILSRVFWPN